MAEDGDCGMSKVGAIVFLSWALPLFLFLSPPILVMLFVEGNTEKFFHDFKDEIRLRWNE